MCYIFTWIIKFFNKIKEHMLLEEIHSLTKEKLGWDLLSCHRAGFLVHWLCDEDNLAISILMKKTVRCS